MLPPPPGLPTLPYFATHLPTNRIYRYQPTCCLARNSMKGSTTVQRLAAALALFSHGPSHKYNSFSFLPFFSLLFSSRSISLHFTCIQATFFWSFFRVGPPFSYCFCYLLGMPAEANYISFVNPRWRRTQLSIPTATTSLSFAFTHKGRRPTQQDIFWLRFNHR